MSSAPVKHKLLVEKGWLWEQVESSLLASDCNHVVVVRHVVLWCRDAPNTWLQTAYVSGCNQEKLTQTCQSL